MCASGAAGGQDLAADPCPEVFDEFQWLSGTRAGDSTGLQLLKMLCWKVSQRRLVSWMRVCEELSAHSSEDTTVKEPCPYR